MNEGKFLYYIYHILIKDRIQDLYFVKSGDLMKKIEEFKGISGNLLAFRDEVAEAGKVTFVGTPGVCTPFAELFAYVIRDKESVFIPNTDIKKAKKIENTSYGMQLAVDADPKADVVVLLGGLAMPKSKVKPEDVVALIDEVLQENGKLVGLCYMDMFRKAGWDKKINFDCIINGTIEGFILE